MLNLTIAQNENSTQRQPSSQLPAGGRRDSAANHHCHSTGHFSLMERSSFPRPSSFPPQQSTEHFMANCRHECDFDSHCVNIAVMKKSTETCKITKILLICSTSAPVCPHTAQVGQHIDRFGNTLPSLPTHCSGWPTNCSKLPTHWSNLPTHLHSFSHQMHMAREELTSAVSRKGVLTRVKSQTMLKEVPDPMDCVEFLMKSHE
jgi:hypothetical protein